MNANLFTGPVGIFGDAILKGTLFLTLLFLLSPLLRKLSAGTRHLVWGTTLVLLVLLPFVGRLVPWRIGVYPAVATTSTEHPQGARVEAPPTGALPTGDFSSSRTPEDVAGSSAAPAPTLRSLLPADLGNLLIALWGLGFALVLLRLAAARRSAQQLLVGARAVQGPEWERAAIRAADHLGLDELPLLRVSEELPLPITLGIRHPAILLPDDAEEWPEARRSSVLLHEMAHIRRKDVVTHLAARLACAVWWFHPLAWRALTRFRLESERAADDLVLAAGRRASEYAQDLLAVVQQAGRAGAPIHSLAMAQRSDFEGRLLAILEPGASRRGVTPMTAIPVVFVVSMIALPFAAIGPASATPALPETTASVQNPASPTPTPMAAPRIADFFNGRTPRPEPRPSPRPEPRPMVAPMRGGRTSRPMLAGERRQGSVQQRQTALALVPALRDGDVGVRESAARALGNLGVGDTTVVAALAQALTNDSDAGVRNAAAWALGQLEEKSAIPALSTALKRDRDLEVRRTSAWALGQLQDASSIDALTSVLNDPDGELRGKVVWALGQIQDARSVSALVPVLRDPDPDIRAQAAWALGQIQSKDAVDGLARAANDSSVHMRSQVAWALGQIQDDRAVPALAKLLHDPVAEVRKQAAWALGQIQSKSAVGDLSTSLHDGSAEVRQQAAWALGQIQDAGAAGALAGALKDEDAEVKKNAVWALGQLDLRQAPPGLLDALSDGNADVRKNAAWAAGQIGDAAAISALNKLLTDADREVQKNALWALGQIDDPRALDGITQLLHSNDPELRRLAAQALGHGH